MPSLLKQLELTKKADILKQWGVIVRLLGTHLHSGADLINKIMTVKPKPVLELILMFSISGCTEGFQDPGDGGGIIQSLDGSHGQLRPGQEHPVQGEPTDVVDEASDTEECELRVWNEGEAGGLVAPHSPAGPQCPQLLGTRRSSLPGFLLRSEG